MDKNKVFETAKTIINGIKTFRSYTEYFTINDYSIVVKPHSEKIAGGYILTFCDTRTNQIFRKKRIKDETALALTTEIEGIIEDYESRVMNFVHSTENYVDSTLDGSTEALLELWSENFEISFHGMKVEIPWVMTTQSILMDALRAIHDEMGI